MKKTKIAAALTGSVMYSVMSVAAAADDTAVTKNENADKTENVQSVVVTGYRASIKKALDNKLASDAIMESIVADDIGKLPEQNIAEAIARVPGVTITRSGGEGQFITVRGLGPAFNNALLNGRILATENQGREYSFDILPAELISGVDIFKSATASQPEGGIGSTVNMKTAQPLDIGNKFALSGQGNYDRQRGKFSPQASGLASVKSADGTFGALVAFSYLDRKIEDRRIYTDGFVPNATITGANGQPITGASIPTWTEFDINDTHRKRVSGLTTVQWRPSDALTITADGLYSKLNVNDNTKNFYAGSYDGAIHNAVVDANDTATSFNGGWGEGLTSYSRPRLAETKAAGLNVKWKASSALSSVFDVSTSKAVDRNGGNQNYFDVNLHAPGFDPTQLQYQLGANNLPTWSNLGNIYDTSHATVNGLVVEGHSVEDKVSQASYTSKYNLAAGAMKSLDFGLNYADRKKTSTIYDTPGLWNLYGANGAVTVPQSLFSNAPHSVNLLGTGMFTSPFPTFDGQALQAYLLTDAAINQTADPAATRAFIAAHGGSFNAQVVPGKSGSAQEKTTSGFVQANFDGDWGDRGWAANVGLRYISTKEVSRGVGQNILSITQPAPGTTGEAVIVVSDPIPLTEGGSYKEWLPSANFKVDVTDHLLFQAAVAKTMTRATLSDLLIARSIDARPGERSITDGNPGLKPMIAWNYDMSMTWYDGKGSSLSGAIFSKKISDFSQHVSTPTTIDGESFLLNRPENFGKKTLSGIELGGQYLFSGLPAPFDGLGLLGNFTYVAKAHTKTYNVGAFYEKGPIELRVAYNYRNAYRDSDSADRGVPLDYAAYGQVDANVSYAINKNLSVYAQGINLTSAKVRSYSIYESRPDTYESYGARYAVGARMSF
jgi:TonB-dependent receptor